MTLPPEAWATMERVKGFPPAPFTSTPGQWLHLSSPYVLLKILQVDCSYFNTTASLSPLQTSWALLINLLILSHLVVKQTLHSLRLKFLNLTFPSSLPSAKTAAVVWCSPRVHVTGGVIPEWWHWKVLDIGSSGSSLGHWGLYPQKELRHFSCDPCVLTRGLL